MTKGLFGVVAGACLLGACGTAETGDASTQDTTTGEAVSRSVEWVKVSPGGETSCSDGSEFFFLTRKGAEDKLLFFLEGGGGCSTLEGCDPNGSPTYKMTLADQGDAQEGIFDLTNEANPFADYSMVYVPYCTGDVHLGANDTFYERPETPGEGVTIHHRGQINAMSAINWVFENQPDATEIFVTGESAGAIPTPLYASLLADHFEAAQLRSLGDGAGGYRYARPVMSQLERWGVFNHINLAPAFADLDQASWSFEELYRRAAAAHPEASFGRFDFAFDGAQSWFLGTNSQNETLLENIIENNADIREAVSNFHTFVASSDAHTIVGANGFYELTSNGTALVDWVSAFADGTPVADVMCEVCEK